MFPAESQLPQEPWETAHVGPTSPDFGSVN